MGEPADSIDELRVHWEGYADACTQVELYIWDVSQNQWGDGTGQIGQNRHADTWAGNRDGFLSAAIRDNVSNYLDSSNTLRVLIYTQRAQYRSVHDFISVRVKQLDEMPGCPADFNGDSLVDGADLGALLGAWGTCSGCAADLDGSGVVDGADLGIVLGAWGACP